MGKKVLVKCPCGNHLPDRNKKYCSQSCKYKFRTRPKGLKYNIVAENKGWFREGEPSPRKGKGKGWIDEGYKRTPEGRVHRVKMESHLNRKLKPYEVVHHKDGDKLNNSLDNLEVMSISDHKKLHWREING